MNDFLKLLESDSRLTPEQLAVMCDKDVGEIKEMIGKMCIRDRLRTVRQTVL